MPRPGKACLLLLLLAWRALDALAVRTFFQPDEHFQALEPAWQLAFGRRSGACITWEWSSRLRSSMHPALFAAVLAAVAAASALCRAPPALTAELLIAAPKLTQAAFAAATDCFTWRLAERAYGPGSSAAIAALALSVCSPWQWFCSTRTLSNCLETPLTAAALAYWPWQWTMTSTPSSTPAPPGVLEDVAQRRTTPPSSEISNLNLALLAAALACVLRPTNLLVWICISVPTLWQATTRERLALAKSAVLCGCGVLALSALADRLYYSAWTFPPLRFAYFNIAKSLAVFYGTNRGDYYLTEGLPLLLTTALPFALSGIWRALRSKSSMLFYLATTCMIMIAALSLISHKEVRFIYPLLPILHVLAAQPLASFFRPLTPAKKPLLALLLLLNVLIAAYVSQVHQRGVIDVLHVLRRQHELKLSSPSPTDVPDAQASFNIGSDGGVSGGGAPSGRNDSTTVAFLMPCHSTPWRSHLVYPDIHAWALTCEPPIDVPLDQRSAYLDEADQFYADPTGWLAAHMEGLEAVQGAAGESNDGKGEAGASVESRAWPQYLVFFEQLEDTMAGYLQGSRYEECWRGFNTHWHDDWRRKGDVVVWCLESGGMAGGRRRRMSSGEPAKREL